MKRVLVWFRQDLRLTDNPALYEAVKFADDVIPVYIFETQPDFEIGAAQCWWLHHSLSALQASLAEKGVDLLLIKGNAKTLIPKLITQYKADGVYWNRCYEPASITRDKALKAELQAEGFLVKTFNASLLNEPWTIMNKSGSYFKVFTPYWRYCLTQLQGYRPLPVPKLKQSAVIKCENLSQWWLCPQKPNWAQGFANSWQPGEQQAKRRLKTFINKKLEKYAGQRDFMAADHTSHLSPSLHFGELSPGQVYNATQAAVDSVDRQRFLAELGWREFSYYLLYHFPELAKENFNRKFNDFPWLNTSKQLRQWQSGETGYPIVDAGMRELWQTGYMHNRVRMIVASFLTKHLLIDWRKGADWFLDTLVDADLASNSASWQWVAGCGADAAPYFRIFNPVLQGEKFDRQGEYIRRWLPELDCLPNKYIHQPWSASATLLDEAGIQLGKDYPKPMIDHAFARQRALNAYKKLISGLCPLS